MRGVLYHIVIAPDYEPEALEMFKTRRSLRVLQAEPARGPLARIDIRRVSGGALIQTIDDIVEDPTTWEVKTRRKPTADEMRDLAFAWKVGKHIKSNTIVLAKDSTMTGMGAGQPNRVTSIHLAMRIAGDKSNGSVLASDAFMPFADNIEMAAQGGITAIAQPGGSIRDDDVIEAANKHGMAMVFTGTRHFKH
jgi:phosphoribosylaminoimidazolecarboxamide formyltransferase/IMP cyclohydrolase